MKDLWDEMNSGSTVLIGMVHLLPLPGTLKGSTSLEKVISQAVSDAKTLEEKGFDGLIVEIEDYCYDLHMSKIEFAGISMAAFAVRQAVSIPIGISCSGLNYEEALAIAKECSASFIRTPVFVDTLINYNGIISPCSAKVIKYRTAVKAEDVKIMADIHVKHYFMLDKDIDIRTSARWAERQGADAIIVTGITTGAETDMKDLEDVRSVIHVPLIVGSGINKKNIEEQMKISNGLIIGTSLRTDGDMTKPIDPVRCDELLKAGGRK